MDCIDNDMYDMEEMSDTLGKDDTAPQPAQTKAQPASAQAVVPPEQEKAPQLLLTAGNAGEKDAAPSQGDTKARAGATSDKASRAAEAGKATAPAAADEGKPGIVFDGKAVIDRFEGKWAVLLLGDDEKPVSVPKKSLPRRVQAGQWLNVQLAGQEGDEVVSAKVDPEETARMKKRIMDKLALLRSGAYMTEGTDEKPPQS